MILHRLEVEGFRCFTSKIAEGHLHRRCRQRTKRYCNNRIESYHRHVKRRLRAMRGPRTEKTA